MASRITPSRRSGSASAEAIESSAAPPNWRRPSAGGNTRHIGATRRSASSAPLCTSPRTSSRPGGGIEAGQCGCSNGPSAKSKGVWDDSSQARTKASIRSRSRAVRSSGGIASEAISLDRTAACSERPSARATKPLALLLCAKRGTSPERTVLLLDAGRRAIARRERCCHATARADATSAAAS